MHIDANVMVPPNLSRDLWDLQSDASKHFSSWEKNVILKTLESVYDIT